MLCCSACGCYCFAAPSATAAVCASNLCRCVGLLSVLFYSCFLGYSVTVLQVQRRQQRRLLQHLLLEWRFCARARRVVAAALLPQRLPLLRHGWQQLRLNAFSSRLKEQVLQRAFAALLVAVNRRRRLEWCQACATIQQAVRTLSAELAADSTVAGFLAVLFVASSSSVGGCSSNYSSTFCSSRGVRSKSSSAPLFWHVAADPHTARGIRAMALAAAAAAPCRRIENSRCCSCCAAAAQPCLLCLEGSGNNKAAAEAAAATPAATTAAAAGNLRQGPCWSCIQTLALGLQAAAPASKACCCSSSQDFPGPEGGLSCFSQKSLLLRNGLTEESGYTANKHASATAAVYRAYLCSFLSLCHCCCCCLCWGRCWLSSADSCSPGVGGALPQRMQAPPFAVLVLGLEERSKDAASCCCSGRKMLSQVCYCCCC